MVYAEGAREDLYTKRGGMWGRWVAVELQNRVGAPAPGEGKQGNLRIFPPGKAKSDFPGGVKIQTPNGKKRRGRCDGKKLILSRGRKRLKPPENDHDAAQKRKRG